MQLTIEHAIAQGEAAAQACADKAEALGFSIDAARSFVLNWLREYGPSWGEDIVDAAERVGRADLIGHDTRCWGVVFSGLSRQGRIVCTELGIRRKGRGTAGARRWRLVA